MKDSYKHNSVRNSIAVVAITAISTVIIAAVALFWYPPMEDAYTPFGEDLPFLPLESGELVTDKVNINSASAVELMVLPGIGEKKAQAIIDYREANGPFETVDDLINVHGIGPKVLEAIIDMVAI